MKLQLQRAILFFFLVFFKHRTLFSVHDFSKELAFRYPIAGNVQVGRPFQLIQTLCSSLFPRSLVAEKLMIVAWNPRVDVKITYKKTIIYILSFFVSFLFLLDFSELYVSFVFFLTSTNKKCKPEKELTSSMDGWMDGYPSSRHK